MVENRKFPVFYSEQETPENWNLEDIIYWRAAGFVPQPRFDEDLLCDEREAVDEFIENLGGGGNLYYLDDVISTSLGLAPDPKWHDFDWNGKTYKLDDVPFYEIISNVRHGSDGYPLPLSADQSDKLALAKAYKDSVQNWEEQRNEALEEAMLEVASVLRSGRMTSYSVASPKFGDEDSTTEYLSEILSATDGALPRAPVASTEWVFERIKWLSSELVGKKLRHWGIVVPGIEVLDVFPPKRRAAVDVVSTGATLMSASKKSAKRQPEKSRGRPPKGQTEIPLRVAEIISERGALPLIADALNEELLEWYLRTTGKTIGLSTVARITSQYYRSPNIEKS